jgi:hypothetical protein
LIGDLNAPNLQWLSGLFDKNVILYKIKGDAIYTSTCPYGVTQYVPTDSFLDPVPVIPNLSAHFMLQLLLSS